MDEEDDWAEEEEEEEAEEEERGGEEEGGDDAQVIEPKKAGKTDTKALLTGSPAAEAKGDPQVVSAGMGPFAVLEGTRHRNRITAIQRILVQWLIAKYGMQYKKVKHDVLKQMVMAVIYEEDMLELGGPCQHVAREFAIRFNSVVKKAELAAGLFTFIA